MLLRVPSGWVAGAARLLGGKDLSDRIGKDLVVSPAKLLGAGWRPAIDTRTALVNMAKAARKH
jgi:UDP-glucose 4-epimerase